MKVTVCFDNIKVVVPCGDGTLLVRDLMHEALLRYKKAIKRNESRVSINSMISLTGGGILDPDDRLCDVADDREQIVAQLQDPAHVGGDGASSVGTNSPDHGSVGIKREMDKRLSMHVSSTRQPCYTPYSTYSLPRESRRKEPLGQDAKADREMSSTKGLENSHELVIHGEPSPLGLHVIPCYDLQGNNCGYRVESIEPTGRIAQDGQLQLHDRVIGVNGQSLLNVPFNRVQEILYECESIDKLKLSIVKNITECSNNNQEDSVKRLQSSTCSLLQSSNTRKIGRCIEVELVKGACGLGFSVTTRDNPAGGRCPIYIKNILPKGAALEDGRLKPGDRLLEVNNVQVTGKSQSEVVSILRNVPQGSKVRLLISRHDESYAGNTDVNPEEVNNVSENNNKSSQSPNKLLTTPNKNRVILAFDIPVHDSEKAGLGVSVKGKTSTSDDNSSIDLGIFIKSVIHGGAASRDGRLCTNDQLLNVNGVSLLGLSNAHAMETLRRAMLNNNSSLRGVINLTVARKINPSDSISSDKNEKHKENKKKVDYEIDSLDAVIPSSTWNPVIDRLTEQYNKNSLRNESYCIATNTWVDPIGKCKKSILSQKQEVETPEDRRRFESKRDQEDKESRCSEDLTYDSQLSLDGSADKFLRDALGRQSMSEKRHAALDAKNTDTYKKNKKLRESRESKKVIVNKSSESNKSADPIKIRSSTSSKSSSTKMHLESYKNYPKLHSKTEPPSNNEVVSQEWLWLENNDSGHDREVVSSNNNNLEAFSRSRENIRQTSLNSALDDRYRRSKKKNGIRSMLRLGKNRKSLNFCDNIGSQQESSNYCSGTINYIA